MNPEEMKKERLGNVVHRTSPLKAIRMHCKQCSGDLFSEIPKCPVVDCPLWEFRFGVRPKTALKNGKVVDPAEGWELYVAPNLHKYKDRYVCVTD